MAVYAGKTKLPKGDIFDMLEGGRHIGPPRIFSGGFDAPAGLGIAYLIEKYGIDVIKDLFKKETGEELILPESVIADTDLSGVVVQSKKDDDDEVIDVQEEDLEVMPRTDVSTEPPEDPKKPDPDLILEGAETVARKLAEEGTEKLINKTIDKLGEKYQQLEEKKKQVPSDPDEREKFYKENVGNVQRGAPEEAMLKATMFHSGALSETLEHIGDLTHRITEFPFVFGTTKEKVRKMIKALDRSREVWGMDMMSFLDEHEQNIKNNLKYTRKFEGDRGLSEEEYRTKLNNLLDNYVAQHEKIPTYNELQEHAKQAAIAMGNLDVDTALQHLRFIQKEIDKGKESFEKKAQEFFMDDVVDTKSFLAKDKNTIQYIEALNPNKIFGEVDLRTIDYSKKKAPVIDYEFNQKTVDTVGAKSIASLDSQVNVDLQDVINRHGFKMPDVNLLNDALKGNADERYWWQKSSQWLDNFLEGHTKEDKDMFFNILSVTSGGETPKENLRLAMGIFSDYLLGQPTRMGLKMQASLNQFFLNPENTVNTPKFGNYSDTFKYFAGITERAPNTVNDQWVATIFGVDPQVLAAQPELYALMTKAQADLTAEVNKTLPEGQELQPFELESLLWSKIRPKGSTNFAQVGPELIKQLQEEGMIFKDGKLNMEELMQPSFVEKLQKTVIPYQEAYKATIEVGSFNTEVGKKIKQLLDYFPEDKKLHNDINKINKSIIRKLILKQDKKPSFIENLVSLVKNKKTDVSRIQMGYGTFEGDASVNMIIPLIDTDEKERNWIISFLGKNLTQSSVAASNFKTFTGEIPDNHKNGMTAWIFAKTRIDENKLKQLSAETGYGFNIRPVAGGFIAEILSFDGLPDKVKLEQGLDKVFGKELDFVYNKATWGSNFVEADGYKENLDEFERSISERMEKDGTTSFNLDYFIRLVEIAQAADKERDERWQKEILDSKKIINLLTKKNITLKRRGGMIEIPHFHYGGFVDVNRL